MRQPTRAKAHFQRSVAASGSEAGEPLRRPWISSGQVPETADWLKYGCSPAQVRAWALAYLEAAEGLWGRTPLVYDGFPDYWKGIGGSSEPGFARYPLWVVNYPEQYKGMTPPEGASPPLPGPWTEWTLWQHCGGGLRLASGAPVDGDVFNGDEAAFAALLKLPAPAPVNVA